MVTRLVCCFSTSIFSDFSHFFNFGMFHFFICFAFWPFLFREHVASVSIFCTIAFLGTCSGFSENNKMFSKNGCFCFLFYFVHCVSFLRFCNFFNWIQFVELVFCFSSNSNF